MADVDETTMLSSELAALPERKLTFKEIGRACKYIGSNYQIIFVALGWPYEFLDQKIVENRHLAFRSQITRVFIQLTEMKVDLNFRTVAATMIRYGMDFLDLNKVLDCNRENEYKDERLPDEWLKKSLSVNDVKIIYRYIDIKVYFNMFLELGFHPNDVDSFGHQFRNRSTHDKIKAMLETFIIGTLPPPTRNTILLAMQECDMDTESLIAAFIATEKDPLVAAVEEGHIDIVRQLLDKGADVNKVDETTMLSSELAALPERKLTFKEIGRACKYIGSKYQIFFVALGCPYELLKHEMEINKHLAFRSQITRVFIQLTKMKVDLNFRTVAATMLEHGMDSLNLNKVLDCNRENEYKDERLPDEWLKKSLSVNDVKIIYRYIDTKVYFNMFLELGFHPNDVDSFDHQFRNRSTYDKIKAMLETFIIETLLPPTRNTILLAMQECDMDTESLIAAIIATEKDPLVAAVKEGHFDIVRKPLDKRADVNKVDETTMLSAELAVFPERKLTFKEIGRACKYIGRIYQIFFITLGCPYELLVQEMEENMHLGFRSQITRVFIQLTKMKVDLNFRTVAATMFRHGMDFLDLNKVLDCNRENEYKDERLPDEWLKKSLSVNDVKIIYKYIDIKVYFNMFLELGFHPNDVDSFDHQFRNRSTHDKIKAMLKTFIIGTLPPPTRNTILLAMQECNMDTESLIAAFIATEKDPLVAAVKEGHFDIVRKPLDKRADVNKVDETTMLSAELAALPERKLTFKEIGRACKYIGSNYLLFFVDLGCPIVLLEQEMVENRHLGFRSHKTRVFIQLTKLKVDLNFRKVAATMLKHGMDSLNLNKVLDCNRENEYKDEQLSDGWLKKSLSVNDAKIICRYIGKNYFNMFLELGFHPNDVDSFDHQFRNRSFHHKIKAMLETFIIETLPPPTRNTILLAMQECDMDTGSLIEAFIAREKDPLVAAVKEGHIDIVRKPLDKGADVNKWNILDTAASGGKSDLVRLPLDKGSDVNKVF